MPTLTRVVVEATSFDRKDLDERSRRTYEVEAPHDPEGLRAQFERLVAHAHPGARLREFADGVGKFADHRGLIVARCLGTGDEPADPAQPAGQDRLFTA